MTKIHGEEIVDGLISQHLRKFDVSEEELRSFLTPKQLLSMYNIQTVSKSKPSRAPVNKKLKQTASKPKPATVDEISNLMQNVSLADVIIEINDETKEKISEE